jgi:hypothetical protein
MADKVNSPAGASAPKKGMTKMEAVRQALTELGRKAKRGDIQRVVKDRFGIQMSLDHISNCKGEIQRKRKQASKAKAAAKTSAAPKVAARKPAGKPPAVTTPSQSVAGRINFGDLEAVGSLVRRLGADQMRALVDLLAK